MMSTPRSFGRRWWRLVWKPAALAFAVGAVLGAYLWFDERPIHQIDAAIQARDFQQALRNADAFLRDHPHNGRAQELKARALAGLHRWTEAIQLFEFVGTATSEGERAWSIALLHQGRWSDAQPLLTHLHQRATTDPEILHELVACNGKLGNLDEAIQQAEQLAKISGYEAQGYLMLGTLQNNRLNRKQAIQAWQRVLQFDREAGHLQITADEFFLAYGRVVLLEGRPQEAIPLLERSIQVRSSAQALAFLGDAYEQTGAGTQAVECWKEALTADAKSVRPREGLARMALQKKDGPAALEWLTPLLESPDLESSSAYLAQRTYAMLGELDQVTKWEKTVAELRAQEQRRDLIETGIQRDPQSFWSRAVLAHRFASSGNKAQAAQIVASLLKAKPEEEFVQAMARHLEKDAPLPSLNLIPMKQF